MLISVLSLLTYPICYSVSVSGKQKPMYLESVSGLFLTPMLSFLSLHDHATSLNLLRSEVFRLRAPVLILTQSSCLGGKETNWKWTEARRDVENSARLLWKAKNGSLGNPFTLRNLTNRGPTLLELLALISGVRSGPAAFPDALSNAQIMASRIPSFKVEPSLLVVASNCLQPVQPVAANVGARMI